MDAVNSPTVAQCPVCNSTKLQDTVWRERLPTMQNYVYRTRESAKAAPQGQLSIAVCRSCGFASNRRFDPSRLVYDAGYDNSVPSAVMAAYYRDIAAHLGERYKLDQGGLVVDVGCGNGAFLQAICSAMPRCCGLGVDPALERDREEDGGRIILIKDMFSSDLIKQHPSLIVCRHVLEHIPRPVEFLQDIRSALAEFGSCPCFFEVPDLGWIVENEVFWDFCYEHCNYFTDASLAEALGRAGFDPVDTRVAYGSQYRWMEALSLCERPPVSRQEAGIGLADQMLAYAAAEAAGMVSTKERLRQWKREGNAIAVWGMATKGVLFSLLVDPDASLIDFCIDVNTNKQGSFVPVTGHIISAPTVLQESASDRLVVVVMNENYRTEIEQICRCMGMAATCVSASGTTSDQLDVGIAENRN